MFTPEERDRLRVELLKTASGDKRITGGAITGSASVGREDRWSDIDLAFGVHRGDAIPAVLSDWTSLMYDQHGAIHHVDVKSGSWIYRVFLLPSTLQVDLAFAPEDEFGPLTPTFRLHFGRCIEPRQVSPPPYEEVVGLAWLYALHARSCIARGRSWQAEYMISGVRDNALVLACLRHGLPVAHARGVDLLPGAVAARFEGALVRDLYAAELLRTFRVVIQVLLSEIRHADEELAARLHDVLTSLTEAPGNSILGG
jgi:hypothetical protein